MMQTILTFLRHRGSLLVMVGFALSFLFLALFLGCIYRHANSGLRMFSYYATFAGIGVFAIGRIGVFLENRARLKRKDSH
jgi:hypothetical protein